MAQNLPKNKEEFLKIKGVNESKYKQWGEIFISIIQKALLSVEVSENSEPLITDNRILEHDNSADSQLDRF